MDLTSINNSSIMDTSRFFPNNAVVADMNDPYLLEAIGDDAGDEQGCWSKNTEASSAANWTHTARRLMNKCLQSLGEPSEEQGLGGGGRGGGGHLSADSSAASQNLLLGTLYCGHLGPRVYLRYIMAKHLLLQLHQQQHQEPTMGQEAAAAAATREAETMLQQALALAQSAVQTEMAYERAHRNSRRTARVTLLESPLVGSKVMEISLLHALGQAQAAQEQARELLELLRHKCRHYLTDGECEVLYGRAGAMQAILFLRSQLDDKTLGSVVLCELAWTILEHGHAVAKKRGWTARSGRGTTSKVILPFHWEWHGSAYLGAAHGVVGILQTILSLNPQELHSLNDKMVGCDGGDGGEAVEHLLQECIRQLDTDWYSFPSGNLQSSMDCRGDQRKKKTDSLVHWCHGAPGHILLLIKAGEVFHNEQFIQKAQHIANTVLLPRGLLRKGVGLCHGIAGNAFCFLALARTCVRNDDTVLGDSSSATSSYWMAKAHYFANFAIEHLNELEMVPDEPYSLFEGVAGLCTLFLALADPKTNGRFPLYDH